MARAGFARKDHSYFAVACRAWWSSPSRRTELSTENPECRQHRRVVANWKDPVEASRTTASVGPRPSTYFPNSRQAPGNYTSSP